MARLERLFEADNRDAWGRASRAINKDLREMSEADQSLILSDPDVVEKFELYRDDPEDDQLFADYVLSLDFSFVKHTDAKPRTYKLEV